MEVREGSVDYLVTANPRVPVGYKQTEMGAIPEDWSQSTIRDIATKVGSGVTPTGGNKRYKEYGRPFVRSQNVGWGNLLLDDLVFIDEETHSGFPATELKLGDVLLNITGASIGRTALADKRLVAGNVNQHVCIIRLDANKAIPEFINLLLLSAPGQRQIDSFQAGGNRQGLNFSQINSIKLPLPPTKAEQEAIAEVLSDADALIESLEQLLVNKRRVKQGAMQELLTGKRRLPGFSGEWEVKRLGDCLTSRPDYGINAPAVPYSDGLPTYIRITDISDDGRFTPESLVSVAHPDAEHYYLNEGDLVFARTGASVGKSYLYNTRDAQLVFAGFLIRIHPDLSKLIPAFLANFVQTSRYWTWVKLMSMRSGQPGINGNEYAQLPIPCPTVEEQTAVATILSDMDAEVFALEEKLAKARTIKQGLMQELLTGKIRLIEPRHGLGRDTC